MSPSHSISKVFFFSFIFTFAINWSKNGSNKETNGNEWPLRAKKTVANERKKCRVKDSQTSPPATILACVYIYKGSQGHGAQIQSGSSLFWLEKLNLGYRKINDWWS